jgi:hypothetical protein
MNLPRNFIRFFLFLLISINAYSQDLIEITKTPSGTLEDSLQNFSEIENYYHQNNDRRELFVSIYTIVTLGIQDLISKREIEHGPWLEDMVVGFSEEYRKAVLAFETKNNSNVPPPWAYDFNLAKTGGVGRVTLLLTSLTSHILNDLPIVISKNAHSAHDLSPYKKDYFALNKMFKNLIPKLFKKVYSNSKFDKKILNNPTEKIKIAVVNKLIFRMRQIAWKRAENLANIKTAKARKQYQEAIAHKTINWSKFFVSMDAFLNTKPGQLFPIIDLKLLDLEPELIEAQI